MAFALGPLRASASPREISSPWGSGSQRVSARCTACHLADQRTGALAEQRAVIGDEDADHGSIVSHCPLFGRVRMITPAHGRTSPWPPWSV